MQYMLSDEFAGTLSNTQCGHAWVTHEQGRQTHGESASSGLMPTNLRMMYDGSMYLTFTFVSTALKCDWIFLTRKGPAVHSWTHTHACHQPIFGKTSPSGT